MTNLPNNGNDYIQTVANERAPRISQLIASKLFLALAVLITFDCALSAFTVAVNPSSLVGLVIPILLVIGVWTLRVSAKSGVYKPYTFAFMKVRPIVVGVVCIILIVAMVILALGTSRLVDAMSNLIDSAADGSLFDDSLGKEITELIKSNVGIDLSSDIDYESLRGNVIAYGKPVMYIAEFIIALASALIAICAFKVSSVTTKLKNTLIFGYDEPINTAFISAVLYISAGFLLIEFLSNIIIIGQIGSLYKVTFNIINVISVLINIATYVLAAIFFGKIKEIME